jgi:tetratricopeptide (TPR) repeat protein
VYLRAAAKQNPDHGQCLRYLGHTLSKMKMHKEALTALKHALDLEPGDKESLFLMAECFNEINQTEQALRIYTHLRTDSTFGPQAALNAGIINLNQRQYAKAIEDLEIGLKHQNIPTDTLIDIKYRLATTYLNQQDIGRAVSLFSEIQLVNPSYKDVNIHLSKYRELNSSRNLQIYQLAPSSEFVTLGRKIVFALFGKAKIKITDVSVQKSDWADILAEVETPKWSDVILIRLIRSTGTTGELILRDFHARIKEVKAGKGICITAGAFSEESKKFVEARLIDLMDKTKLLRILNAIDTKQKSLVNK